MKKVFIKYNPYKLETEFKVDGKQLARNSVIGDKISSGSRLQEWVEELPELLHEECNDEEFDITFHGTLLDYEDLNEVFTKAEKSGILTFKLERIPAKETKDKEQLIDNIFEKIKQGPFEELRDAEIINAFEHAKSSDFEVCVVATMSAGKSTLINAMLGDKLMPSKQEACTAIITKIKDNDDETGAWQCEVYDKDNHLTETHGNLSYDTMVRLNSDENVSVIKAYGNIPFVSSEDVSLVLIDTPGPNNSRDPEHKRIQSEFLKKSSKSLVLYIMEGTFGSDDDNALLKRVAESMKVGGKQSKDRFIFVVNKMDDRRQEDGDTSQTLERICTYLKKHGISNPNLFPAAALPALNIRQLQNQAELDEDTVDETDMKIRKFTRKGNDTLHFENYAPLPSSIRSEIIAELSEAKQKSDAETEALIHTGIISVEAAIRQYVQKYAKTAKIKNIVDTFIHKLEEVGCLEATKQELAKNREYGEQIAQQIANIRNKIDSTNSAKAFKNAVDDAVIQTYDKSLDAIENISVKYQEQITEKIGSLKKQKLNLDEVEYELKQLERFAKALEPEFQSELDELISENLINTGNVLLEQYKKKLESLTEEIDFNSISGIKIDPLKLMSGSVVKADSYSFERLIKKSKVEDGEEWVANTKKKWYKPWTWFQEKGYWRKKYKTVEYVQGDQLAQDFLAPLQENFYGNADNAKKYVNKQSNKIAKMFEKEFARLDNILKDKLSELEAYASEKDKAEELIKETEAKLNWLDEIKKEVNSILDI